MQQDFSNPCMPDFALRYLTRSALPAWPGGTGHILGMIAYGLPAAALPACDFPSGAACLEPAAAEPVFEVWTASSPVQRLQVGDISGAFNDRVAFGIVTIPDQGGLEFAAERAYLDIFAFLQACGNKVPIRFWNYLSAINEDEDGMERYRRFNIGRHRAFSARLKQKLPPAASAVGGHEGNSIIYFLAAPHAATPVENPRQVSAYDYPEIYGPRSPSFSRASVYPAKDTACLFISGTASILGHETRHQGDVLKQIAETAENLRAVIGQADRAAIVKPQGEWALKIYLHDANAAALVAPALNAVFGPRTPRLYLRGDICRRELLVEIEAFRQF